MMIENVGVEEASMKGNIPRRAVIGAKKDVGLAES
jgi:hypothetical protein